MYVNDFAPKALVINSRTLDSSQTEKSPYRNKNEWLFSYSIFLPFSHFIVYGKMYQRAYYSLMCISDLGVIHTILCSFPAKGY